jgi:thiamine-monophosphate kinase
MRKWFLKKAETNSQELILNAKTLSRMQTTNYVFKRRKKPMNGKEKRKLTNGTARRMGEHCIIEFMRDFFEVMPNMTIPFGDDVSALPINEDKIAVLKTDMLVAKTDRPRGMSNWQAARKAVVMNVSDFAAKGVQPQAALVSLGLPRNTMTKEIEDIAKGLNAGAREYGAYIIGGDTGEASDLIISIQLFGTTKKDALTLRSGAKPGDIVAVTGFFGKTAAGLKLLLNEECEASHATRDILVSAVCMPKAKLQEGIALQQSGSTTASIDSSDGLAWCLHELAKQSKIGFTITAPPVADEVRRFAEFNNLDPNQLALYGGEEYELVLTVNPKKWPKAEAAVEAVGGTLLPIGKATRDQNIILDVDGNKRAIEPRGYEHFKTN